MGADDTTTDPRRIACLFSTSGHSGVDRLAKSLLPALAQRGYRVDLLKVRGHGPYLSDVDATSGLRVIDLGRAQTYACLPAIVRYLREYRPAVLLSDKDRVNRTALAARALARVDTRLYLRSGTTVSVDLASRGMLERHLQGCSVARLYPLAAGVLVPSRGAKEDLVRLGHLDPALVRVVPSPVVPDRLFDDDRPPAPEHPWFHDHQSPLILGVGELSLRKDFATLLQAFAALRARRPCRLMILGRGRERQRLLALAETLGVAADLSLPGFVAEPYPYLAHADLFAFTSRWEGLGFVLIEALALGTPVVSTDCPSGPREILHGGRYGRLVPIGDAATLAQAMAETLAAPLPARHLQQAARPYAVQPAVSAYLAAMGLPPGIDSAP